MSIFDAACDHSGGATIASSRDRADHQRGDDADGRPEQVGPAREAAARSLVEDRRRGLMTASSDVDDEVDHQDEGAEDERDRLHRSGSPSAVTDWTSVVPSPVHAKMFSIEHRAGDQAAEQEPGDRQRRA